MGGEKNRQLSFTLDLLEHLPDVDAGDRVKAGRGFIQEKDLWAVDKPARHLDPAPHAAREGMHLGVAPFGQADDFEQLLNRSPPLVALYPVKFGVDAQIFPDGELRVAGHGLRNHPDLKACAVGRERHVLVKDHNAAARDRQQRRHHPDQRALSGSVGPEQAESFAGINAKGDVDRPR